MGVDGWGSAWREWLLFQQNTLACGEGKVFCFGPQETWVEDSGRMQERLWLGLKVILSSRDPRRAGATVPPCGPLGFLGYFVTLGTAVLAR